MKSPLIIANWKMKVSGDEALTLARQAVKATAKYKSAEIVLCPGFTELAGVASAIKGSSLKLGAQDCFWEESGAFTGEISPQALFSYGASYVIIGHSERREHLAETGAMIRKKIFTAFRVGLVPVLCIGESFSQRQEGQKEVALIQELHQALDGLWLTEAQRLVVAYEPVWVIGSGQAVSGDEAEHTHQVIKQTLYDLFPASVVQEQLRIIYGGSVDPENVAQFTIQPTVDGVLVGGASLDATVFTALVAAAVKAGC
ncbi:MAG: triose-phosphate isomerase [Candidatus Komeilibacteria bacterium RIFCSPLOWO2_02_FULL_48_11]|uniref:Triosephosphate isomerase n=1 Tax=Candidatus Komeilibacteria bacterium RIFCSPLOWO2_02_FULL_48_11 TaxID=1798553 RepID=A0A1G2BV73_9BACT|nr:MAG: triose-phosphate isomerase [Candidatus Komeilibacteria bacterium RIFCSPLOWO2_02_FULL_48_11]